MMTTKDLLLAIDNGTQSIKALVFGIDGRMETCERLPLVPYTSPRPGWAEQDPDYFWQSLCKVCRKLLSGNPAITERLAGLVAQC